MRSLRRSRKKNKTGERKTLGDNFLIRKTVPLFWLFFHFLNQIYDRIDGVLLRAVLHGLYIGFPVLVQPVDGIQQDFVRDLFFFQNDGVPLFFEGAGVQDLIAPAGVL